MDQIKNKNVTIMVCGGIAAYKSADLVSQLTKQGASVRVIMTRNACKFIAPLTLSTLSKHKVYLDVFDDCSDDGEQSKVVHIMLAQKSDMIVIAPATANVIGKIANGLADDLLTATVMAAVCPVLICPAMNENMYNNPLVQDNLRRLSEAGYTILSPDSGRLACGTSGKGRLPETSDIIANIKKIMSVRLSDEVKKNDIKGRRILITAGPTVEEIDPVRFISNYSSGKMGFALAEQAVLRGAEVTLIHGPVNIPVPRVNKSYEVQSALEMKEAVDSCFDENDIIIMAAAVADYRPESRAEQKIIKRSDTDQLDLILLKNPDILAGLGQRKNNRQILVGFAAETENLTENALRKMKSKNVDLLVANDVSLTGSGFYSDNNIAQLMFSSGEIRELPKIRKHQLADIILDAVVEISGK